MQHLTNAPSCATDIVLPVAGVVLAAKQELRIGCAMPLAELSPVSQVVGVEVDDFQLQGTSPPPRSQCVGPATVNGMMLCIETSPAYGEFVAQVRSSGHPPVTVKIGLSGDGLTDRTVLYSMQRAS